jgi:hypothetical protein
MVERSVSSALSVPHASFTTTKRRRWFWALWISGPPTHVPFRKPDASDGGAATYDEALAAATARAGTPVLVTDPLWARAWMRVLRGQEAWPSRASREPAVPRARRSPPGGDAGAPTTAPTSIWEMLGVGRDATDEELKAAYRKRVLAAHPDHGGDDAAFRAIVRAYDEAKKRRRRPARRS